MMIINSYRFSSEPPPEQNTYIGGVGATISTPASLVAVTTGLTVDNIQNFVVDVDNNVSCFIDVNYVINAATSFPTSLTYFIDLDGLIIDGITLAEARNNLKHVYLPNAVGAVIQFALDNNSALKRINVQSLEFASTRYNLTRLPSLKKLYLPSFFDARSTDSQASIHSLAGLERLYIGALTTFGTTEFNRSLILNPGRFPIFLNVKTNCKVYYNSALGVQNRKAWNRLIMGVISIGDIIEVNGLNYTAVVTPSADGEFDGTVNGFVSAVNSDGRTGDYSFVTAINDGAYVAFQVDTIGALGNDVTLSIVNEDTPSSYTVFSPTFVGGNDLHVSLMYLRDERSCTMIEVSAPITVNAPTGLNTSNQTSNSVDLNFNPPTANANGTDAYEVWVDDGTVYRKLFEYAEISASGDTLDLSEVVADVGSISGVKIKIRTIDGQMNFSEFSNEIILP